MPPINITGLRLAKQTSDTDAEPPQSHVMLGHVRSVHEHHGGKHVEVNVVHGRRKVPKATKGQNTPYAFDDRPESRVLIPKHKAKNYGVGTRVHVMIKPAPVDQDEDDANADD